MMVAGLFFFVRVVAVLGLGSGVGAFVALEPAGPPSTLKTAVAETVNVEVRTNKASKDKELQPVLPTVTRNNIVRMRSRPAPGPMTSTGARSPALPFLDRPLALEGSAPGDVAFDPLRLATKANLRYLCDAEVKHARFAMLGILAWPGAELRTHGCVSAPSKEAVTTLLVLAGAVELYGLYLDALDAAGLATSRRIPGDLGFDPLGMLPVEKNGRKRMQASELKHGRLAMLALAGCAAAEAAHGRGVVDLTPALFQPFWA